MIRLVLQHDRGCRWRRLGVGDATVHYKGNDWEIGASLPGWVQGGSLPDDDALLARLAELPWSFAVVVERPGALLAVVDSLRTQPLFCGEAGGVLCVTDDPYAPAAGLDTRLDDPLARAEFELSGYVLGERTLSRGIRALRAGECLRAQAGLAGVTWRVERYRPEIHQPPLTETTPAAGARLVMELCDELFGELVAGLAGRQVVLPLSSGVDSRFIACMLKRHGHGRVLSFTYGRSGNWEVPASRRTAERLGLPWHFVPYSRPAWREWYASAEMGEYQPFAARHVATPHVQDWPAVRELKRRGLVEEGAVFVPGHTAMLISNRLDKPILEMPRERRLDGLAAALFRHHFMLQRVGRVTGDGDAILRHVRSLLPPSIDGDNHRLLNAYFNFEATERHGKMLINSVRVYEFFGHGWALPLWDDRIVKLWAQVPYSGRYAKRWFRELLASANLYGLFPPPPAPGAYARARQWAKDNPLTYGPLKRVKCLEERLFGYFHHFLDWYGIVSYPEYVRHMGQCGNVYSLLSRLYLQRCTHAAAAGSGAAALPRTAAGGAS